MVPWPTVQFQLCSKTLLVPSGCPGPQFKCRFIFLVFALVSEPLTKSQQQLGSSQAGYEP